MSIACAICGESTDAIIDGATCGMPDCSDQWERQNARHCRGITALDVLNEADISADPYHCAGCVRCEKHPDVALVCPCCHLAALGKRGGSVSSDAKRKASKLNGAKGGRPKKSPTA